MKHEVLVIPQRNEVISQDEPYEVDIRIRLRGATLPLDHEVIIDLIGIRLDHEAQLVVVAEETDVPLHTMLDKLPSARPERIWLMLTEAKLDLPEVGRFMTTRVRERD